MLDLTTEQREALASRRVMRRFFVWCEARNPETGAPDPAGFWDDVGTVEVDGRTYHGTNLVQVSTLSAKSDNSIPGLTITLSGLAPETAALVRGSTVGQAPIEVFLGIFDVDSHAIILPLIPRFRGKVDDIDILTPPVGDKSTVTLTCESDSRALTIKGTGTRSAATQNERAPADKFYDYTAAQREQPLYFGRKGPDA